MRSLNYWARKANDLAHAKGFYANAGGPGERIALIHSELSELLECYRRDTKDHIAPSGKPEGPASEAADVFLRLADFCQEYGIDLDAAVEQKHAFNLTRPLMHGGKKF